MNTKCVLPWIHFSVGIDGNVLPCASASIPMGNLNTHTIKEIWTNEKYTQLRQQLIDGEEPKGCKICFEQERQGGFSKRLRENKLWEQYLPIVHSTVPEFKIRYVHTDFSNVCNFKCRTCNPSSSHSIAAEWKQLDWPLTQDEILRVGSKYWDNFLETIPYIEEIYILGGEPILMDEHYRLLQMLIDAKNFDVRIRYNSNVSKLHFKNYNVLDYWKHFKHVSIHASLDDIGDKLEYTRHGSKWIETLENLKILKSLPNMNLRISCCVSVFNILRIHTIYKTYIELGIIGPNDFGGSILYDPTYYSIQSLHPDLKKQVKTNIEDLLASSSDMNDATKNNFIFIINHMYEKDEYENNKEIFKEITTTLDNHRKENLLKTFPELELQYD